MSLSSVESVALENIDNAKDLDEVEALRLTLVGKKGSITELLKSLGSLPIEEKKTQGPIINKLKNKILQKLNERQQYFLDIAKRERLIKEKIDISAPVEKLDSAEGRIHPLTKVLTDIIPLFTKYGFNIADGSDIETDYYNFIALNFPENHPAREMHDTFFLKEKDDTGKSKLLRTHTSPVQIRSMLCTNPPLRVIIPGKTYRMDEDSTHSPMFNQMEGLVIEKNANIGQMRWILAEFCKEFFNSTNLKMRFRPSFFPFTQPSMEVDINCSYKNEELTIGEGNFWLEILGCGMVHPNVLKSGGIDPEIYQGFAWGLGLERLAMLKYGIKDLRAFFNSDINWLRHYGFKSFSCLQILQGNKPHLEEK